MERTTFLGLGPPAKGLRAAAPPPTLIEEHAASCADAAIYLPASGILRPVPSKLPAPHPQQHQQHQQFMSFKPLQDDGLGKKVCGEMRMSGFQTVLPMGVPEASSHRASAPVPQKSFAKTVQGNSFSSFLNLTNKHSFPLPSHPSRGGNPSAPQVNGNVHLTNYPYGLPVVVPAKGHGFVGSSPQGSFAGHYPHAAVQQQHRVGGAAGHEAPGACPANVAYNNTRNSAQPLPTHGQLTIFFGGMVNVYENVSLEKVQAIMSMAASGSSPAPENSTATKQVASLVHPASRVKPVEASRVKPPPEAMMIRHPPQANDAMLIRHPPQASDAMLIRHAPHTNEPVSIRHRPQANAPPPAYSGLCSPTSAASPSVDYSASSSSNPDEPKGSRSPVHSDSKASADDGSASTKTTPMSKAVPMARKASLARFLEKRKERISHLAPYPAAQKLSDGSSGLGARHLSSFPENHTTRTISNAPFGAKDQRWHPGRAAFSTGLGASFVNTELEM